MKEVEIKPNERGVIFKRFEGGVDTTQVYQPGKYKIPDHDRLIIYNIDSQVDQLNHQFNSQDEALLAISLQLEFKPIPDKVALLHYYIGEEYYDLVVKEKVGSVIDTSFSDWPSQKILSNSGMNFNSEIEAKAKKSLATKYIELESLKVIDLKSLSKD
jgi:hypothetical protein